MNSTLVLPGILWNNIKDLKYLKTILKINNFNRLIKKSSIFRHNFNYNDFIYNKLFDNKINGSIADFLVNFYNIKDKYQTFLVAQPTQLNVKNDGLTPTEPELLELTNIEEDIIIKTINNYFNQEIKIYYIKHNLWLIGLNFVLPNSQFYSIMDILGKNIDDFLPKGTNNILFSKILNEIQMLLHTLDINNYRKNSNRSIINSIWMWDQQIKPLDFLDQQTTLINNLYTPCCYNDIRTWITNIEELDTNIINTFTQQINTNEIDNLRLFVPRQKDTIEIKINKKDKYKFWKNNNFYKIIKDNQ